MMWTTRYWCLQQVLVVMVTTSLILGMWGVAMALPEAVVQKDQRQTSRIPMMRGPWYDVGHTTYIWGSDTWTSQKWDMLQGPDGTAIILYSAKCPSCSVCIKTHIYSLEPAGEERAFLVSGHGETMLFEMKRLDGSRLLSIICFDGVLSHEECRRRNRFQVYWVQETMRRPLTSSLKRQTDDFRFTALQTQPRRWSLRINQVTNRDNDIYVCYTGKKTVAKFAIFVAVGQGEQLRLLDVQPSDNGVYKCLVNNGFGPTVRAYVTVNVAFPPEVSISEQVIYKLYGETAQIVCQLPSNLNAYTTWLRDGDVLRADENYVMTSLPSNQHVLTVRTLRREDFGEYVCQATNHLGRASAKAYIKESWPSGDQCKVNNIPAMTNFTIETVLSQWERLHATPFMSGAKLMMSMVHGEFLAYSGSKLFYFRQYSDLTEQCLETTEYIMTRLDTEGDYYARFARVKKLYQDYNYLVTYLCVKPHDDDRECPRDKVHVSISSRYHVIPKDVLSVLYTYVSKGCVPVSSLVDMVPGLCKVSSVFATVPGFAGPIEEPSCTVDSLKVPSNFNVSDVTGTWHLVATARPDNNSAAYRSSVHIVVSAYSTFLFADSDSLVLITCLVVLSDGTCRPDSQLVEVFSRGATVSKRRLVVLKQPVANACVDIAKLQRTGSGNCSIPETVSGVILEDIRPDSAPIGCRHDLVAIAAGFSEEKFLGRWQTIHKTTFDTGDVSESIVVRTPDGRLQLLVRQQNNQCNKSSLLVEILARNGKSSISGDKLHLLQQHIVNVCVDLQHVKRTAEDILCTIPARVQEVVEEGEVTSAYDVPSFDCNGLLLRGIRDIDLEDIANLTGKWNVLWRTWSGEQPPESNNNLNTCKPTEAVMLESTSGLGDYYSSFDESPAKVMKILYADDEHLMTLWCSLNDDADCVDPSLELLSRHTHVDDDTRQEILRHVNVPCIDVSTLKATREGNER
ncbi:hypothetical protein C0Q70_17454 [Pomacea canaliculata]|uniref:Ig-like domain-containing protein n=1 Tax=Pomacea canaliculata TaxID=400727 RepID=A0A2T7NKG8_POMCA|nr:hypothetical protein C0Q70_17454 [Pomacea canaliculata]